jgi:hypothetical protein
MADHFISWFFRLGDALAASNCKRKEEALRKDSLHGGSSYGGTSSCNIPHTVLRIFENKENINCNGINDTRISDHEASVQSIILKMQSGLEVG